MSSSRRRETPRRDHSTDFPAAERPRRGRGVPALTADGRVPASARNAAEDASTGRRLLDFGGALWRRLVTALAVMLAAGVGAPAIGAAYLAANDKPYAPYLESMQSWTVNVLAGLAGLLLVQLARRQGITQRSQKTLQHNQFATAESVAALADELAKLREDLAALRPAGMAGTPAGEGVDVEVLGEAQDRVLRAVGVLEGLLDAASKTGPLRVVAVRRETPPPPGPLAAPRPVTTTAPVPVERPVERTVVDPVPPEEEPVDVPLGRPQPPPQRDLDEMLAGGMTWAQIVEQMDADAAAARAAREYDERGRL